MMYWYLLSNSNYYKITKINRYVPLYGFLMKYHRTITVLFFFCYQSELINTFQNIVDQLLLYNFKVCLSYSRTYWSRIYYRHITRTNFWCDKLRARQLNFTLHISRKPNKITLSVFIIVFVVVDLCAFSPSWKGKNRNLVY